MKTKRFKIARAHIKKAVQTSIPATETLYLNLNNVNIEFSVTPKLTLPAYIRFINDVVENVFIEVMNDQTMKMELAYMPYYEKLAIENALITHYTNLDLNASPEELFILSSSTDIIRIIKENIDWDQYTYLTDDLDKLIEHKKQKLLQNTPLASLVDMITLMAQHIQEKVDSPEFYQSIFAAAEDGSLDVSNEN